MRKLAKSDLSHNPFVDFTGNLMSFSNFEKKIIVTQKNPLLFSKGQCTWGASCRFVHPGVLDKGNYNMFAPPRPILPTEQEPIEKVIFIGGRFRLEDSIKI